MAVTSVRPYIFQAMLDWMLDNKIIPHIVVKANEPQVCVPKKFIEKGKIVLNIDPDAVRDFMLSFHAVSFKANFSGEKYNIFIPLASIEGIYAPENGQGILLDALDDTPPPLLEEGEQEVPFKVGLKPIAQKLTRKPFLRVLRKDDNDKKDS